MSLILYHKGTIVYPRAMDAGDSPISPMSAVIHHNDKIWFFPTHISYCIFEMEFDPTFRPANTGGETFALYIDVKSMMLRLRSVRFPEKLTDPVTHREVTIDMLDLCCFEEETTKQPKRVFGWSFDPTERAIIMASNILNKDLDTTLKALERLATFKVSSHAVVSIKTLFRQLGIQK